MKTARRTRRKTATSSAPGVGVSHAHRPPVLDWTVTTEWGHNGRHVAPGTELKIAGAPGRFRFLKHVSRPNGIEWVDVIGGPEGAPAFRSFRPSRVRTVHRITKTRVNVARLAA